MRSIQEVAHYVHEGGKCTDSPIKERASKHKVQKIIMQHCA